MNVCHYCFIRLLAAPSDNDLSRRPPLYSTDAVASESPRSLCSLPSVARIATGVARGFAPYYS